MVREDGATVVNWELLPDKMPIHLKPSELVNFFLKSM